MNSTENDKLTAEFLGHVPLNSHTSYLNNVTDEIGQLFVQLDFLLILFNLLPSGIMFQGQSLQLILKKNRQTSTLQINAKNISPLLALIRAVPFP